MWQVVCAFILSFLFTYYSAGKIIYICKRKNLYDEPAETRKVHKRAISNLGGIAMYCSIVLAMLIISAIFHINLAPRGLVLAGSLIIFFIGITDDLVGMNPLKKLGAQILAALLVALLPDADLSKLFLHLGLPQPGWLFIVFMKTLLLVVLINAFNLIDGINLLAAGIGFLAMVTFSLFFYQSGNLHFLVFCLCSSGALLAFMNFNRSPARLFMGDSGSMQLGLITGICLLESLSQLPLQVKEPGQANLINSFLLCLTALSFPVLDMIRVFFERLYHKKSPISPDKTHFHHRLLDRNFTHHLSTALIILIQVPVFLVALWSPAKLLPGAILVVTSSIICYVISYRLILVNVTIEQSPANQEKSTPERSLPVSREPGLDGFSGKTRIAFRRSLATTENEQH